MTTKVVNSFSKYHVQSLVTDE